ncbi:MAG: glutathione S-transferase family protein [Proteobacteria bacterium]|nr:glutathione S-transferase family protein [Pseudomonadota bacterium]
MTPNPASIPVLHGFRPSVYVRAARLTLAEKGVLYELAEVNPFAPDVSADYRRLHPFKRVPTLVHDGFTLYETGAITRYVDRAFAGPPLQPTALRTLARQDQILGMVDSYIYWPLVRQVFVHAVARPARGETGDAAEIAAGLAAAGPALAALEALAVDDAFLVGPGLCLADLHLLPMIAYFAQAPEGAARLARHARLQAWWTRMAARPSFGATDPHL